MASSNVKCEIWLWVCSAFITSVLVPFIFSFCIGNVCEIIYPEAEYRQLIMHHLDGYKMYTANIKRFQVNGMHIYLRDARVFKFGEDVGKLTFQRFLHTGSGVNINSGLLLVIERAYIVQPGNVVFMFMSEHDGIQVFYMLAQHLVPEIGARINHHHFIFGLNHNRGAQPFIVRVIRGAYLAVAGNNRYALRCSGA